MYSIDRNYEIERIFETENFSGFRKGKLRVTGGRKAADPSPNAATQSERTGTAGLPKKQSLPDIYLVRGQGLFPFWETGFFLGGE
jgi:hypothetical protein